MNLADKIFPSLSLACASSEIFLSAITFFCAAENFSATSGNEPESIPLSCFSKSSRRSLSLSLSAAEFFARSLSASSIFLYRSLLKSMFKTFCLSSASEERNFLNSPCGKTTTWRNCSALNPKSLMTSFLTARSFVSIKFPSRKIAARVSYLLSFLFG